MTNLRVAIIGGGPAGVVAIKALLAEGKHFSTIKAYERGSDAGGAWNHSPVGAKNSAVDLINNGSAYDDRLQAVNGSGHSWHFPTPMYNELNTNTPARLMSFNNVDFPQNTEAFPKRQAVLQYLRQHAQDVSTYISFDQEVVSVRKDQEKQIWTVQSRPNTTSADVVTQTEDFDRVVIASGHYDVPKLPNIPGMKVFDTLFPGTIHHSKYYRTPTEYTNQTVLVVGSGPSAIDITSQIARVTSPTRIFWSQRTPSTFPIPAASEGVQQVAEIERMASNGCIHLKDGRALSNIDRVLFCTGYLYSFPYLDQSTLPRQSPLVTNGERLHNLYEHLFYIPDPTLAVLAMNMNIIPFCFSEAQACYMSRVWAGRITLPTKDEMYDWQRTLIEQKGDSRAIICLPHPEDGEYIDRLRKRCVEADEGREGVGMLPVDWLNSDRIQMRRDMKTIRAQWLAERTARKLATV